MSATAAGSSTVGARSALGATAGASSVLDASTTAGASWTTAGASSATAEACAAAGASTSPDARRASTSAARGSGTRVAAGRSGRWRPGLSRCRSTRRTPRPPSGGPRSLTRPGRSPCRSASHGSQGSSRDPPGAPPTGDPAPRGSGDAHPRPSARCRDDRLRRAGGSAPPRCRDARRSWRCGRPGADRSRRSADPAPPQRPTSSPEEARRRTAHRRRRRCRAGLPAPRWRRRRSCRSRTRTAFPLPPKERRPGSSGTNRESCRGALEEPPVAGPGTPRSSGGGDGTAAVASRQRSARRPPAVGGSRFGPVSRLHCDGQGPEDHRLDRQGHDRPGTCRSNHTGRLLSAPHPGIIRDRFSVPCGNGKGAPMASRNRPEAARTGRSLRPATGSVGHSTSPIPRRPAGRGRNEGQYFWRRSGANSGGVAVESRANRKVPVMRSRRLASETPRVVIPRLRPSHGAQPELPHHPELRPGIPGGGRATRQRGPPSIAGRA